MRRILIICLLISSCVTSVTLKAQTEDKKDSKDNTESTKAIRQENVKPLANDSLKPLVPADTIVTLSDASKVKLVLPFKPNPKKAIIYSAIFPGLGQIYNRRYWKLPIIYGGFIGITYAVTWNGRMYNDYSRAYTDLMTGKGESWKNMVSTTNPTQADIERWKPLFKRKKDYFRRNRDLAIICGVGLYALCLLDAYVDAQLYDFDVSPDLSMRVEPVMYAPTLHTPRTVGIQCSIFF